MLLLVLFLALDLVLVEVVTGDQFAQLMVANSHNLRSSESIVEGKLADIKAELCKSQEDAAIKAVKRSKAAEKPFVFKKGNEAQARFNCQIEDSN